jgi:hypothetical protein
MDKVPSSYNSARGAQLNVRRQEGTMIRYTAVFALLHLMCSALVGYFTWWRESHGGIVGGGLGILCIFLAVQAASVYFVHRENRLPTRSEIWAFLLQSCGYLLLLSVLIIWLLLPFVSAFAQMGWLVSGAFALAVTLLGFWASKPAALDLMQKYLKRRESNVA